MFSMLFMYSTKGFFRSRSSKSIALSSSLAVINKLPRAHFCRRASRSTHLWHTVAQVSKSHTDTQTFAWKMHFGDILNLYLLFLQLMGTVLSFVYSLSASLLLWLAARTFPCTGGVWVCSIIVYWAINIYDLKVSEEYSCISRSLVSSFLFFLTILLSSPVRAINLASASAEDTIISRARRGKTKDKRVEEDKSWQIKVDSMRLAWRYSELRATFSWLFVSFLLTFPRMTKKLGVTMLITEHTISLIIG